MQLTDRELLARIYASSGRQRLAESLRAGAYSDDAVAAAAKLARALMPRAVELESKEA